MYDGPSISIHLCVDHVHNLIVTMDSFQQILLVTVDHYIGLIIINLLINTLFN